MFAYLMSVFPLLLFGKVDEEEKSEVLYFLQAASVIVALSTWILAILKTLQLNTSVASWLSGIVIFGATCTSCLALAQHNIICSVWHNGKTEDDPELPVVLFFFCSTGAFSVFYRF